MSTLLLLVLSVLSLSFPASDARYLGDLNPGRALHHANKDGDKLSSEGTIVPATITESLPEKELQKGFIDGGVVNETDVGASFEKPNKERSGTFSGLLHIQSLVTVSWHLPHEKHDEQPGFHLDYSPPRIHPPSHN